MGKKKLFFQRSRVSYNYPTPLILTWNISANDTITLPITGVQGLAKIDWGDGSVTEWDNSLGSGGLTHTFVSSGQFDIAIAMIDAGFLVDGDSSIDTKILELKQWGNGLPLRLQFQGCENMVVTATDIPNWSKATSFQNLFRGCSNITTIPNINSWDVSTIRSMDSIFYRCRKFNQDLNGWNTSSNTSLRFAFYDCDVFNGDITNWDVTNIAGSGLYRTFEDAFKFNQDLSGWNVTNKITSLYGTFYRAYVFNSDLNGWDVSNVTTLYRTFASSRSFNGNLSGWDVSNVTNMQNTFNDARVFNSDIGGWNISNVTNMAGILSRCYDFNQDIDGWNVEKAQSFSGAFSYANNILPMPNWNPISATSMNSMFANSTFNHDISMWDVSSVQLMENMFSLNTSFNKPLNAWTTSSLINIKGMFNNASAYKQELGDWDITNLNTDQSNFFANAGFLPTAEYDATLIGWAGQNAPLNVTIDFGGAEYTLGGAAEVARDTLINTYGWVITDGGGI